jgi:hypothetical protein
MEVKKKLGEIIKIINMAEPCGFSFAKDHTSTDSSNQLDEIVWNLLMEINYKNLDYVYYYSAQINLNYQDFINVWHNFIKKNILEIPQSQLFDLNTDSDCSALRLSLFENKMALEIEELFNIHLNCMEDDLLLFYIKNQNKILLMFKSYEPLLDSEDVRLPFWEYIVEHPKIKEKFDEVFNSNDNICIMGFSI